MKRLCALVSLILLVCVLMVPTVARAETLGGWTWDEAAVSTDGWTWDEAALSPEGWTWDEA